MHRINEVCLHVNRTYLENERVNLIKFHKESLQIELDHDSEMSTPRSPLRFFISSPDERIFSIVSQWRYFCKDPSKTFVQRSGSQERDRLTNDAVKGRFRARAGARWRGKRNNTAGGIRE